MVTTVAARTSPTAPGLAPGAERGRVGAPRAVLGVAVAAAVLRLVYVHTPLTPDEGGLLTIARQWHPGSSLYGDFWVDRPPLLLALARVADAGGGLVALQLLGCLAAGLTVLGVGLAVRQVTSTTSKWAAVCAAAVTAALLISPLAGAAPVNGELLAAPFIAIGVWLAVVAVEEHTTWAAAAAGGCGVAAVLVKQNMLDVLVFAVVLALVAHHTGSLGGSALRRVTASFAAGGLVIGALVLETAWVAGTSPGGVFFAMYPFRWRAMTVVESHGLTDRITRLALLGTSELLTVGPFVIGALAVVLLGHGLRGHRTFALAMATLVLATYDVLSIAAGGSYWSHYLVELAVPTGLAAGVVVARMPRLGTQLVAVVLVSASIASVFALGHRVAAPGMAVGSSIGRVAAPGDTVVSLLGDPAVVESAGLPSPYPYLWSLPARTLDPNFDQLAGLLTGPRAPTWVVMRGPQTRALLGRAATHGMLASRYRLAAQICGRDIYLHSGVERPTPREPGHCKRPLTGLSTPLDALTDKVIP